jgi:large subunit ribosomal protein L22
VRINADKFKKLVRESGMDAGELARALPRPSDSEKQLAIAEKKLRNWMSGRDHPRAKSADISALAQALGVQPSAFCRWTSTYRFARSSERKSRLVVDMIRGRGVEDASNLLQFSPKRASVMVNKALQAAIADAESADADLGRLVVSEARADEGMIIKRFRPKDRGRAHPIQKRTSHIVVSVEEAV